jgi:putative membrane protein
MIIPGISGAFLLLVLGLYVTVIKAVSDFNIPLLFPVALGAVIGLILGAALVRYLLAKAPRQTYGAVLGLVAGSIIILYPGGMGSGSTIAISALSLLAGAALSFISGRQKPRLNAAP